MDVVESSHNGILYNYKKMEYLLSAITWIRLDSITFIGLSQREKEKADNFTQLALYRGTK